MLVLCETCNNHYDDSSQEAQCSRSRRHFKIEKSPLEDHINLVAIFRDAATTRKANEALATGSRTDAAPPVG